MPSLGLSDLTVNPLTCSEDDKEWSVELPSIENEDLQEVTISMTTESEIFNYDAETSTINLSDTALEIFSTGEHCPEDLDEISLEFSI